MAELSIKTRCIAGIITGLILHAMIFHPWMPYSVRERHVPSAWAMAAVLALAGLILTFDLKERRAVVLASIVGGMFAANTLLIAFDWMKDSTSHNLFPFEFIMIGFAIVPAAAGAFLGHMVERLRA
jgi:hypothetical protein